MSVVQSPERIHSTIAAWKSALLDLSARNPLVALPPNDAVDLAAANDMFDVLIRRRKPFQIWDISHKGVDRTVLREAGNYPGRAAMMEKLHHLHLQAAALLQGQDINVLYLAFGVLAWHEPDSDTDVRSPLLIVPVSLEPHAEGTGYTLQAMEEPVEVNPILRLRLAREDVGLNLPAAPDERYLVPSAYLRGISDLIEGRDGWRVEEMSALSRFPLLKLRLYEDLVAQEARAEQHPLVAALSGEPEAIQALPAVPVPPLSEIDQSDFAEGEYQMLDADPAQQRAIVAAARGQNLVLQGPPGTGKTQTITNIIGECVAAGKSVLLVSGRMASLDAVYQRLAERGLGDLCLVAHSLKTSKRDILQQLDHALSTPRSAGGSGAAARANRQKEREEAARLRQRLNTLAHEMHRKREPLGLTPYEAVGVIAGEDLSRIPTAFSFPVDNPAATTAEQYGRMEESVALLAQEPAFRGNSDAGAPGSGSLLWAGALADTTRPNLEDDVFVALMTLAERAEQLEARGAEVAGLCGNQPAPQRLADLDQLLGLAEDLCGLETPLPRNWLTTDAPAALREHVVDFRQRYEAFSAARAVLTQDYDEALLDLPLADITRRLSDPGDPSLEALLGADWRERAVAEFDAINAVLEEIGQDSRLLHENLVTLSERSGIPLDESPEGRGRLLRILQRAIDLPNPCVGWFAPGASERLVSQLADGWDYWTRYERKAAELFAVYTEEVLTLDFDALLPNLIAPKTGLARLLSPAAARDQKIVRAVLKPQFSLKDRDFAQDFQLAKEVRELAAWCDQNDERLSNAFGAYYRGADTDWENLRDLLYRASLLASEFGTGHVPPALIALMLLGDTDLPELAEVHAQTSALMAELRDAWERLTRLVASQNAIPAPQTPLLEIADWSDAQRASLSAYHEAYRSVAALRRGDEPITAREAVAALESASRLATRGASFHAESEAMRPLYGAAYNGLDSDWGVLEELLESAGRVRGRFPDSPLPESLIALLTAGLDAPRRAALAEARVAVATEREALQPALDSLGTLFRAEHLVADGEPLSAAPLAAMREWARTRLDSLNSLKEGIAAQAVRDRCAELGLAGFFDAAVAHGLTADTLLPAFRVGFHRAWLRAVTADIAPLAEFNGAEHHKAVERFRELDRRQMDAVPAQIKEITRGRSPKQFPEEIKTLKGQLARRRTGEVRRLLAEIPKLLFTLKPVVMMNPLSVRHFLEAEALQFDVIVFDDASQIATEEAIGAVLRGRQVIIAGDPKQIPPMALNADSEKSFESILDRASAVADKQSPHFGLHVLNWHYRSRNESLIAFSRRYFYPELVAFPAATVGSAVRHESISDPSVVAATVVDRVLEYTHAHPEHTAGVIVLDDFECEAVQKELARRKAEDPDLVVPDADGEIEGFFVKTIENVQGDERDLIVFCASGDPNRCVPLTLPGGERLLNVATTRARDRMLVLDALSSPEESAAALPEGREGGEAPGVRFLRAFVSFAARETQNANATLEATETPLESEEAGARPGKLEQVVAAALTARGHIVRHQVGQSDYRVDLAVIDPAHPDRYLIGIECDSAMYASAETARHRDRLCAEMLTERGWNLYRLWSLDWERDPEGQLHLLEQAIAAAKGSKQSGRKRRPSRAASARARRASEAAMEAEAAADSSNAQAGDAHEGAPRGEADAASLRPKPVEKVLSTASLAA